MAKRNYNLWIGILIVILITLTVILFSIKNEEGAELNVQDKELQAFTKCINKNKVELYGRRDSKIFIAQEEEFGPLFEAIPFIDCVEEREKCEGILLVPTWKINGQVYYGSFSKEVLIKLLGCK